MPFLIDEDQSAFRAQCYYNKGNGKHFSSGRQYHDQNSERGVSRLINLLQMQGILLILMFKLPLVSQAMKY